MRKVENSDVQTIEGLERTVRESIAAAFADNGGAQCGFCIPGIVMAAAALLKRNAAPSEEAVAAAITNLCRCGIYPRLIESIQRAGRAMRGDETITAGARPGIDPADAVKRVPALSPK